MDVVMRGRPRSVLISSDERQLLITHASGSWSISIHGSRLRMRNKEDDTDNMEIVIQEDETTQISLDLKNEGDKNILSTLFIPIVGSESIIRIDALLSLIFRPEEKITVTSGYIDDLERDQSKTQYTMSLTTVKSYSKLQLVKPSPKLYPIRNYRLSIDKQRMWVSKEILALNSSYFTTLLYRPIDGNFEPVINEVDPYQLRYVLNLLHQRKFHFVNVSYAIVSLRYSDQFLIKNIRDRAISELLSKPLAFEEKGEVLIMADALSIPELVEHAAQSYDDSDKILAKISRELRFLSPSTLQTLIARAREVAADEKEDLLMSVAVLKAEKKDFEVREKRERTLRRKCEAELDELRYSDSRRPIYKRRRFAEFSPPPNAPPMRRRNRDVLSFDREDD